MKKQLIVVVHGVGVRSAGLCAGQLSAALNEASEAGLPQQIWRPHSSDDFYLHEAAGYGSRGLLPTFAAHLRRFRRYADEGGKSVTAPADTRAFVTSTPPETRTAALPPTDAQTAAMPVPLSAAKAAVRRAKAADAPHPDPTEPPPPVVTHERVVADYFWGDISGTGGGGLQVLVGLVKIILGLSHAIRENAMDVFPGLSPRAIWMRRIARTAPLMIHGPIAALNIVLLLGVFLAAALRTLSDTTQWPGLAGFFGQISPQLTLGVVTMVAGFLALRWAQVYLLRHLFSWVIIVGGMIFALTALEWLASGTWIGATLHALDGYLMQRACDGLGDAATCTADYIGMSLLGLRLMGVMMAFWALTLLCALITGVATHLPRAFPERSRVTAFVQPAIALMTLLWFLLMAAVWASVLKLWPGLVPHPNQILSALRLVTPAAVALLLLVAGGLALHLRKTRAFANVSLDAYLPHRDTWAETHRLIVGVWLLRVLTLFTAATILTGFFSTLGVCPGIAKANCSALTRSLSDWVPTVITLIGLAAAALVGVGRSPLAMGIAIVTDVLVYLNDYSWRSREAALGTTDTASNAPIQTRTMVERATGQRAAPIALRQGYWLRARIHDRMRALMATLIRDEAPDEIVIVSHSQGTMIAIDMIEAAGQGWLAAAPGHTTLKLVTMGSPYIHVYNTYFPSLFPARMARPRLRPAAQGGLLTDWVNIFRVDDFVGTHIDTRRDEGAPDHGTGWPREVPVPPNGHTNYWVDQAVFPPLVQVLRFGD